VGCGQGNRQGGGGITDQGPNQVVLSVAGMTWPTSWKARAEKALASLPWVDQKSVQVSTATKQAGFLVTDPKLFDVDQLKAAFANVNFHDVTVTRKPGS